MWLCGVHNRVNERLGKEEFDCANVGVYFHSLGLKVVYTKLPKFDLSA